MIAKNTPSHLAPELLKVENAHKEKTVQIANMINCMKFTENPITEKATPEKNHFWIC